MGKPDKKRWLLCGGLTLLLAGVLPGGALAAPPEVSAPSGKTAVGVQTVDVSPSSLSYTVPLYLTVAVAAPAPGQTGTPQVTAPNNYCLKNTADSFGVGKYPGIAVTGVKVQGITGGTWSLKAAPAAGKEICLSIGGLTLPEVKAGNAELKDAELTGSKNSFYDPTGNAGNGKFLPISGGPNAEALSLAVVGKLPSTLDLPEEKAAAQFRIKYTVSLLDGAGKPVGVSYEGPSKEDVAGMVTPSS